MPHLNVVAHYRAINFQDRSASSRVKKKLQKDATSELKTLKYLLLNSQRNDTRYTFDGSICSLQNSNLSDLRSSYFILLQLGIKNWKNVLAINVY